MGTQKGLSEQVSRATCSKGESKKNRSGHLNHKFLRVLAEENDESSTKVEEQELAISKVVEAMESNIGTSPKHYERKKEKHCVYANEWREKFFVNKSVAETKNHLRKKEEKDCKSPWPEQVPAASIEEKTFEEAKLIGNHRKVAVLYELISACLAGKHGDDNKSERSLEGYGARHCAALRLLTTWFDIKYTKMVGSCFCVVISSDHLDDLFNLNGCYFLHEAIGVVISCSAMDLLK